MNTTKPAKGCKTIPQKSTKTALLDPARFKTTNLVDALVPYALIIISGKAVVSLLFIDTARTDNTVCHSDDINELCAHSEWWPVCDAV